MNKSPMRPLLLGAIVVGIGSALVGCSSDTPKPTPEQAASFKGGPMPPEARQKMEEAIQKARDKKGQ